MLYSERYVAYSAAIHRTRTLPVPGRLLRRVGDHVASDSVIAETDVPSGYRLLELDRALGMRVSSVRKVMLKQIGDWVEEGEVIARTSGLFKAECTSPVQGQILDARANRVLIEVAPRHVELTAFYSGQVAQILPNMGAVVEVTGALVQGAWGIGAEARARLDVIVPDGETALKAEQISAVHLGAILVGGRTLDADAIAHAIGHQIRALIVGSISSELVPIIQASSLSVMLTEGFGDFPMDARAFELLRSYAEREACFTPAQRTRWGVRKPELIIPLPSEGTPTVLKYGASLAIGARVRALRAPYESAVGEVVALPLHPHRLESGTEARGAVVDLASIGKVFVPFENLEILH